VFNAEDDTKLAEISTKIEELIAKHPLYPSL
jgi:hypothetical protein